MTTKFYGLMIHEAIDLNIKQIMCMAWLILKHKYIIQHMYHTHMHIMHNHKKKELQLLTYEGTTT
jgi:hypothetical protein